MERMHEIMKERVEADDALGAFHEEWDKNIKRLNKEMAFAGPVKIGEIVEVTGYANAGKKMIVDRIRIVAGGVWDRYGVKARGRVLKKDGTPGLKTAEHFIEVAVAP